MIKEPQQRIGSRWASVSVPTLLSPVWKPSTTLRAAAMAVCALTALGGGAATTSETVIDFEAAPLAKPMPSWTEKEVVFALAGPLVNSKAAGRVMFFPYLPTPRKGILNAMAQEQGVPLRAAFPRPVSHVALVLWGSTGCPAKVQAFDAAGRLVDEAAMTAVPGRKDPADPVPQFELSVRGSGIMAVELSGPRTGEYLAVDELRFEWTVRGGGGAESEPGKLKN